MNKYTNFKDWFEYMDENEIKLKIPVVQRPLVWDLEKLKKILDEKEKRYFGSITLIKNNDNTYSLVDGQQRVSNFLIMYKLIYDIKKTNILTTDVLPSDYKDAMSLYYGFKFNKEKIINREKMSELENKQAKIWEGKLNEIGLAKRFKLFLKRIEDLKFALLNCFISINTIQGIDESEVFIDLNNEGASLAKSDILKALFIKKHSDKKYPNLINKEWQEALLNTYDVKKIKFDSMILNYLSTKGKNIRTPSLVNYYQDEINSRESKERDKFIEATVEGLTSFINNYAVPIVFKENIERIAKSIDEQHMIFTKMIYSMKYYKIFTGRVISLMNSSKNLSRERILKCFILVYFSELNRLMNNEVGKLQFHRPADIRENGIKNHDKINFNQYVKNIFNKWEFANLKSLINEDALKNVSKSIIKLFVNSDNTKMNRYLIDWLLSDSSRPNDLFNNYTLEHVFEKTTKSDKKKEGWKTILLEEKIHMDMNIWSKHLKLSQKKLALEKMKFYKKSNHGFTKKYNVETRKGKMTEQFNKYYGEKLISLIKNKIEERFK